MAKVVSWTPAMAEEILRRRFESSRKYRELFESQWRENYNVINNANATQTNQFNLSFEKLISSLQFLVSRLYYC